MTPQSLGLDPQDLSALIAILQRHIPRREVWAFGSRVRGTARPFSDLDLVIVNDQLLDVQTRAELNYDLSESNLPFKVDLVEWARADQSFRDIIQQEHLVLRGRQNT